MSFDRSAMTILDLVKSATAGGGSKFTSVGFSVCMSINQGYRSVVADTTDGDKNSKKIEKRNLRDVDYNYELYV